MLTSSLVETFESLYKNCELIGYPKILKLSLHPFPMLTMKILNFILPKALKKVRVTLLGSMEMNILLIGFQLELSLKLLTNL